MTNIVPKNADSRKPSRLYILFQKQSKMAKLLIVLAAIASVGSAAAFSMSMSSSSSSTDRRSFVRTAGSAGAAVAVTGSLLNTPAAIAADAVVEAESAVEVDADGFVTSDSGLKYKVTKEGTGAIPEQGQTVKVSESIELN